MTFPVSRIAEIQINPDDYKLIERIPITKLPQDAFPVTLAPATGDEITAVIVDVETTGFNASASDVIELGLAEVQVSPSTGRIHAVTRCVSVYNDPGYPIPDIITSITGITDDMVKGHHIDPELFPSWFAGDPIVIAHNSKFDRPFFHKIAPQPFHALRWACSIDGPQWRTLGFEGNKLEYLAYKTGYFYEGHRASIDALATAWVLHENPEAMQNLLASEEREEYTIKALGAPFETKDALKSRGYRWDGQAKYWHTIIAGTDLAEETAFLAATYHKGDERAEITQLDSRTRFLS